MPMRISSAPSTAPSTNSPPGQNVRPETRYSMGRCTPRKLGSTDTRESGELPVWSSSSHIRSKRFIGHGTPSIVPFTSSNSHFSGSLCRGGTSPLAYFSSCRGTCVPLSQCDWLGREKLRNVERSLRVALFGGSSDFLVRPFSLLL
jgi:hypothetical protein